MTKSSGKHAPQIDWYYHRPGRTTCRRAQEFLADRETRVVEQVHAGKHKISPAEAVKLAHSVRHVFVAKGKKVFHFDMGNDPPSDAELKKHLIGPSGNL